MDIEPLARFLLWHDGQHYDRIPSYIIEYSKGVKAQTKLGMKYIAKPFDSTSAYFHRLQAKMRVHTVLEQLTRTGI